MKTLRRNLGQHATRCLLCVIACGVAACADFKVPALEKLKSAETDTAEATPQNPAAEGARFISASQPNVDLSFLLSMSYAEAKAISAQSLVLPSGTRIAADSIEILKTDRQERPKKLRAKGKVYMEIDNADGTKVLCQEVYINGDEAVLRGKPILQRGGSIVEGIAEDTVFYLLGTRLRVIGTHRLTNQNDMIASLPDLGPWSAGPNPLLPPLTEGAVPINIRAEMLKAAEAEAALQQAKLETPPPADAKPAPWIKEDMPEPSANPEPEAKKKKFFSRDSTTTSVPADSGPEKLAMAETEANAARTTRRSTAPTLRR